MAKGAIAKEEVVKKISEAFGSSFIGEFDKNYYKKLKKPLSNVV